MTPEYTRPSSIDPWRTEATQFENPFPPTASSSPCFLLLPPCSDSRPRLAEPPGAPGNPPHPSALQPKSFPSLPVSSLLAGRAAYETSLQGLRPPLAGLSNGHGFGTHKGVNHLDGLEGPISQRHIEVGSVGKRLHFRGVKRAANQLDSSSFNRPHVFRVLTPLWAQKILLWVRFARHATSPFRRPRDRSL
jgi:hypothetical protein